MKYALVAVVAYLIGSIPFSVIISKHLMHDDIRRHGSGNPGSSNMLRTFGVLFGVLVFLLDGAKGLLGTLAGRAILGYDGMLIAAIFTVIGHNWPIFLRFRGGKGAATSYGAMLAVVPMYTGYSFIVFLVVFLSTGYASLASIMTYLTALLSVLIFSHGDIKLVIVATFLVVMGVFRHAPNIRRLLNKTEHKVHFKWHKKT